MLAHFLASAAKLRNADAPKKIFISYSHADKRLLTKLETFLAALQIDYGADLSVWSDQQISPGSAWEAEIEQALSQASVAILLITANFLASNFIQSREIPVLLERKQTTGLSLFPILGKACAWQAVSWLKQIQLIPRDNKPVWRSGGRYVDEELTAIVDEIVVALTRPAKLPQIRPLVDEYRARLIYEQIVKDAAGHKAERERISKELRDRIFSVLQDKTLHATKRADTAFNAMDAYIRDPDG